MGVHMGMHMVGSYGRMGWGGVEDREGGEGGMDGWMDDLVSLSPLSPLTSSLVDTKASSYVRILLCVGGGRDVRVFTSQRDIEWGGWVGEAV